MFINKVSPSKIKVFDECKAKYKFKYIHYLKEEFNDNLSTDALQFGQYIHKVLEDGVNCKTYEELVAIAKSVRSQFTFSKEKEMLTEASLRNFIVFNKDLTDTVSTEMRFSVPSPCEGYDLNGIIDRVVMGKTGDLLVIDYKTSKRAAAKKDLYHDAQMQMYAYAIHKMYDVPIDRVTVAHYYPHLDKFVSIKYSAKHISLFLNAQKSKVWDIRKRKKDDFHPVTNRFCDWCGYKDICPAYGADPKKVDIMIEEIAKKRRHEKKLKGHYEKKGKKP
jgi:putative RecB family exonuclease